MATLKTFDSSLFTPTVVVKTHGSTRARVVKCMSHKEETRRTGLTRLVATGLALTISTGTALAQSANLQYTGSTVVGRGSESLANKASEIKKGLSEAPGIAKDKAEDVKNSVGGFIGQAGDKARKNIDESTVSGDNTGKVSGEAETELRKKGLKLQ